MPGHNTQPLICWKPSRISYQLPSTMAEGWKFGLLSSQWVNQELLCILESNMRLCMTLSNIFLYILFETDPPNLQQNGWKEDSWCCTCPSTDLNLIEMSWQVLKRTVYKRSHKNLTELKQCCKEECAKIPPQQCEWLIKSHRKQSLQVIAAKGVFLSWY